MKFVGNLVFQPAPLLANLCASIVLESRHRTVSVAVDSTGDVWVGSDPRRMGFENVIGSYRAKDAGLRVLLPALRRELEAVLDTRVLLPLPAAEAAARRRSLMA